MSSSPDRINGWSTRRVALTERMSASIEVESQTQLVVRPGTQNVDEATRARRDIRPPDFRDRPVNRA